MNYKHPSHIYILYYCTRLKYDPISEIEWYVDSIFLSEEDLKSYMEHRNIKTIEKDDYGLVYTVEKVPVGDFREYQPYY